MYSKIVKSFQLFFTIKQSLRTTASNLYGLPNWCYTDVIESDKIIVFVDINEYYY